MKVLVALLALVALASSAVVPTTSSQWTLAELSAALEDPATNPAAVPYLEHALNEIMTSLMAGQQQDVAVVTMPVVSPAPATVDSSWSLAEISAALDDPATNPAAVPYLVEALNALMADLMAGGAAQSIVVALPVGVPVSVPIAPAAPAEVAPASPIEVAPVQVAPAPPTAPAGPLVQIVLNINQLEVGQQIIDAGIAAAPVTPESVSVIETAPETVSVIETAPETVSIVETAPVSVVETAPVSVVEPAPVTVVESAPAANPIDVIAVAAPEYNPVDVIAVAAPEVNPIDLLNPVVTPAVIAGEVVGILV